MVVKLKVICGPTLTLRLFLEPLLYAFKNKDELHLDSTYVVWAQGKLFSFSFLVFTYILMIITILRNHCCFNRMDRISLGGGVSNGPKRRIWALGKPFPDSSRVSSMDDWNNRPTRFKSLKHVVSTGFKLWWKTSTPNILSAIDTWSARISIWRSRKHIIIRFSMLPVSICMRMFEDRCVGGKKWKEKGPKK